MSELEKHLKYRELSNLVRLLEDVRLSDNQKQFVQLRISQINTQLDSFFKRFARCN